MPSIAITENSHHWRVCS